MQEDHQREQFWFDRPTLAYLHDLILVYGGPDPVLLCAPMLGQYLWEKGRKVMVLDTDTRFASLPGFQVWDIHHPFRFATKPTLILCDPPFFTVKLDRLYRAIRILAHEDVTVPLVTTWVRRREAALLGTFALFGLKPMAVRPGYVSTQADVGLYGSLHG